MTKSEPPQPPYYGSYQHRILDLVLKGMSTGVGSALGLQNEIHVQKYAPIGAAFCMQIFSCAPKASL